MPEEILYIDDVRRSPRDLLSVRNLIFLVILCLLAFGLAAAVLRGRAYVDELARAYRCELNLRQVGVALSRYEEAHGSFPPAVVYDPAGRPMHSWRALILPYLQGGKYASKYRYDEPWDGPSNRKLATWDIPEFSCPNNKDAARRGMTSFVAVVGPTTMFPPEGRARTRANVEDGVNDTVMLVETTTAAVPWSEPRDIGWDGASFAVDDRTRPSVSSADREGAHVLKVNGEVSTLPRGLAPATLKAILTIAGGEITDPF